MAKLLTREELLAEGAAIAERLAEEDRLIEAFGLADLLPEFPQDDNYQAWQEWHRQMGRGPVTRAGMIEAYRRGYFAGMGDAASAFADRIKELKDAIQKAAARLQDYADMTADQWAESVADGGITAWMVIRQELRTVVAGELARALLEEAE